MADAYSTLVLASSPVAYYRLGEPSGTTVVDSSGNGLNMVAGTSVTRNSTGLLAVGSDSAVTIPATPLTAVGTITSTYAVNALQVSTAFTLECWYKPTQVTAEVIVVLALRRVGTHGQFCS
jgi:hypothetical protein